MMRQTLWTFLTLLSIFACVRGADDVSACGIFELLENFADISEKCKQQMYIVCRTPDLLWNLFDASGKFPMSGLSYSTKFDYGNFPQCLSIKHETGDEVIKGKYCALGMLIPFIPEFTSENSPINSTEINIPKLLDSLKVRAPLAPIFRDSSEPQESAIEILQHIAKISMCVPDACTPKEVGQFFLYGYLSAYNIVIFQDLVQCETVESNTEYEAGDIAFITALAILALIMILSTIYDYEMREILKKPPSHPILIAFSILTNGEKLLRISEDRKEQITVFNGMRFISLCWVVSYHAVAVFQGGGTGILNWPDMRKWDSSWTNRYILSALLAVDTFIYISGFVLAYGFFKHAPNKNLMELIKEVPSTYLHRYLRITPAAGAMFLFTITIYRFMGVGPLWSTVTSLYSTTCRNMWWKFFLYIQNYTDPDSMCVNPSWYLSADMQLFVLAPLVLIPSALFIKKRFNHTMYALIGLTVIAVIVPPVITITHGEAKNVYTTHDRFNNFLIGIIFGAFMRFKRDEKFVFSPGMNLFLWAASLIVSLAFNIYWFDVLYRYDLLKYALFMGLYRPVWCICLSFMVYSCYHGQGGIVNWFLSLPTFQILARLSFSMYVIHVHVVTFPFATETHPVYFSDYLLFYKFCGHIIVTFLAAIVWVLAFEMPMITIEKILRSLFSGASKDKNHKAVS